MREILKYILINFLFFIVSCNKNTANLQYTGDKKGDIETVLNVTESIIPEKIVNEQITFLPLNSNETLKLYLHKTNSKDDLTTFIICAEGEKKRRLFQVSEIALIPMDNKIQYSKPENNVSKHLVFAYFKEGLNNTRVEEILAVNGEKGIAQKLKVPHAADFKISNDGSFLCLDESNSIPTIGIYDLRTMKQIKSIQYLPYEDRGMYAVEILYEDSSFIVTLSADTVEFTTLKIPINDIKPYDVIDSYEFEENVSDVSIQKEFGPQLPK